MDPVVVFGAILAFLVLAGAGSQYIDYRERVRERREIEDEFIEW